MVDIYIKQGIKVELYNFQVIGGRVYFIYFEVDFLREEGVMKQRKVL